jgi:hypothetical protein
MSVKYVTEMKHWGNNISGDVTMEFLPFLDVFSNYLLSVSIQWRPTNVEVLIAWLQQFPAQYTNFILHSVLLSSLWCNELY